jgi:hypothetical protein
MFKDSSTTINMRVFLPGSMKHKSMRLKQIRKNTVHIRRPRFTGPLKTNPQSVPLISISGKILKNYGFEVGRLFEVFARKGFLLLIAKKFKYQEPKLSGRN